MVPWTHLREPFLRWMWTDLTSEFAHFNVVIRLSKVKQLARRLCTFFDVLLLLLSWFPRNFHSVPVKLCRTTTNLLFCRCTSCLQCSMSKRQQACPFPAGVVFFGFWWGQTYCAPNSFEFEQLFTAHVAWSTTVPFEGKTHELLG